MARWNARIFVLSLPVALLCGAPLWADGAGKKPVKDMPSFGVLRTPAADAVCAQAHAWLRSAGKTDAATQKAFDALWTADRPLLDKVVGTFTLGEPAAAQLLREARDPDAPAPTAVPDLTKDK